MKIIKGLENLQLLKKRSAVTIGVFDGVHIGHQKIIKQTVAEAAKQKICSVLITFDPHPLDVLRPKAYPTILTGLHSKLHLIQSLGIDIALVIEFNKPFSRMSADKFIKDILVERLNVATVIVGEGFRFGAQAKGDIKTLKKAGSKYDFSVKAVPLLKSLDEVKISSTRIRHLLKEGELEEATRILGHRVILSGKVVVGKGYGNKTGFHTANIETPDKASVPKEGVYTGFALLDLERMPAVLNIGPSPTFDIKKKRIEVHILGYNQPLYDKEIEVELIARLRDIVKFKDAATLSKQILKDIERAKKILAKT